MVQGRQAANVSNKIIIMRILLDVMTPILQEVLQRAIKASEIFMLAKECHSLKLTEMQWRDLEHAKSNGYSNFDIPLIYKLAKHIRNPIIKPTDGWGLNTGGYNFNKTPITCMKYPSKFHVTEGDDIERIYRILNDLFHNIESDITDDFFEFFWKELQNVCGRMESRHLNKTYLKRIADIRAGICDTRSSDISPDSLTSILYHRRPQGQKRKKYTIYLSIILVFASILLYHWYQGDEHKHVLAEPAPFKKLKTFLKPMDNVWGTYLPSAYFGFSTATSRSPFIGLMFLDQNMWHSHCDGRITSFGWNVHDGISFGSQSIKTDTLDMTIEFLKDMNDLSSWEIRIANHQIANTSQICLIVYAPRNGTIRRCASEKCGYVIEIMTEEIDRAFVKINSDSALAIDHNYITLQNSFFNINSVRKGLKEHDHVHSTHNAVVVCTKESYSSSSFSIRLSNVKDEKGPIPYEQFSNYMNILKENFNEKFRTTFHISSPVFNKEEIKIAKIALSNVLGSIGYFKGSSVAYDVKTNILYPFFEEALYTSTPSRVFQAHGHFWDAGFHNMLIAKWDIGISLRILSHWLDMMDNRGWIPREQILDDYSKVTIPWKYIPQFNDNVSPPTFLLPLKYIAEYLAYGSDEELDFLRETLKRMKLWFRWYTSSQAGHSPYSYRWRGRNDPHNVNQTNKMTLSSGIDDYPRALYPDEFESHLDLKCWITMATRILIRISDLAKEECSEFEQLYSNLKDEVSLNKLHWDDRNKHYGDYGLHSEDLNDTKARDYKVVDNIGYVSLFPFLLKILEPNSEKLFYIIKDLENPNRLWTIYGIRSLSKSNFYYQRKNEKDDTPQWRGSIRININYLIIGALKYYSEKSAKYGTKFQELYYVLRENVINNIINVYKVQGSFYEMYNDIDGKGQGHFPSTGTSSMLVLIMSETYY